MQRKIKSYLSSLLLICLIASQWRSATDMKVRAYDDVGNYKVISRYYEGDPQSYDWACLEYMGKINDTNSPSATYIRDKAGDQKLSGNGSLNGRRVFCIIPTKMIASGSVMEAKSLAEILAHHYYLSSSDAKALAEKLSLIAYYGWENSAKTDLDRVATQFMIWLSCGWQWDDSSYSIKPKMDPTVAKRIGEIESKIKRHALTPSFNDLLPELKVGESFTFKDNNGVLSEYMRLNNFTAHQAKTISNTELTWDGKDSITIKPLAQANGTVEIKLPKIPPQFIGSPLAFFGESQSVTVSRISRDIPAKLSYRLKTDGKIRFYKRDENGAPVKGVVFSCSTASDFHDARNVVTDEHGESESFSAPLGSTVYYREIFAPTPLIADQAIHSIVVDRENVRLEVENKIQKGQLKIVKSGEGGSALANVEFALYRGSLIDESKLIDHYRTDQQGEIAITDLPLGNYLLVETETAAGYVLDAEPRPVQLLYNNAVQTVTYTLDIENKRQLGEINIYKSSASSKLPLAGARYRISAVDLNAEDAGKFPEYMDVTSDDDGIASFTDLPLGTYEIVEIEAPSGYVLDTEKYTVCLEYAGQQISISRQSLELNNQPQRANLRINKLSHSGLKLSDAEFKLTYISADYPSDTGRLSIGDVLTATTDEEGIAEFSDLPLGHYQLSEVKAPSGYVLNTETRDIHLRYDGQENKLVIYSETIENSPQTGEIIIHKLAKSTGLPLADTTFAIQLVEPYTADIGEWLPGETVIELTTDQDGRAELRSLPLGRYLLRETKAAENMVVDDTEYVIDLLYGGQTVEVVTEQLTLENEYQLATIQLQKVDRDTKNGLAAAKFTITAEDFFSDYTGGFSIGDTVATLITDELGKAESDPLPLGRYKLTELEAPTGYILSSEPITIDLLYGDQNTRIVSYTTTSTNQVQRAKLTVRKLDHHQQPLTGAIFAISALEYYNENDQPHSLGEVIAESEVDDSGILSFEDLPLGRYLLQETRAPYGYLPHTDLEVDLPYAGQEQSIALKSIDVDNQPQYGKIRIHKSAADTGADQAGAKFQIIVRSLRDTRDHQTYPPDTAVDTLVTDSKGMAESKELPLGSYILREIKAPAGYLPIDDLNIELNYAGQAQELSINSQNISNQPTITIIDKIDGQTGQSLSGATFELSDSQGTVVHRWISQVEPEKIYGLHLNETYTLREITAPSGYATCPEQNLEILAGENTFKIANSKLPKIGRIRIFKHNQLDQPLAGVEFTIYNRNDEEIAKVTTDSDGLASFELPFGEYRLSETKIPEGYVSSGDHCITVNEQHRHQALNLNIVNNPPQPPTPPIAKTGSQHPYLVYSIVLLLTGLFSYVIRRSTYQTKQ